MPKGKKSKPNHIKILPVVHGILKVMRDGVDASDKDIQYENIQLLMKKTLF